jgi:Domain of unknown function (DUF1905)
VSDYRCTFEATIWEHEAGASWHFVSLPEAEADDIDEQYGHSAAGFGSIRVDVSIGNSNWKTSIFPDTKRATYVLPIKKAIRSAEGLSAGSVALVSLSVIV